MTPYRYINLCLILVLLLGAGCERVNIPVGPTKLRGRIVFYAFQNAISQLFTMFPDDPSSVRILVNTGTADLAPRWSPDGKQIAFVSDREGSPGFFRLYVMDANGKNVRGLFDPSRHQEGDLEFAWSPDGKQIALVNRISGFSTNRRGLYIVNVKTLDRQLVAPAFPNRFSPDWSPDGSRIAFVSNDPTNGSVELHIMSYPASTLQTLGTSLRLTNFPRWSPDGRHLAFTAVPDPVSFESQIFIADSATFNITQVTHIDGGMTNPAPLTWSPDSQRIVFAAPGTDIFLPANRDIYSVRNGGTDLVRLTSGFLDETGPDWTPID